MRIKNFFTSGFEFSEFESELKNKFQMINIAMILSSIGLIFGIIGNIIKDISGVIPLELTLISINILLFFVLRRRKNLFKFVSIVETIQFTFLFLFLIYTSAPEQLKFIWIFTYPIILLYFQNEKNAPLWVIFMLIIILIAPVQPYIMVHFSEFQVIYISVVLSMISVIIYFYQQKMDEAKNLIIKQQEELKLTVDELLKKDKMLSIQSKQAVMGEMLSMIAHQWRQPLSSVTLSISDIQVKKMLGKRVDDVVIDTTLQNISDTVVYLSETIEDFKTYFKTNKEMSKINIDELIQKAINFVEPRLKGTNIAIKLDKVDVVVETYSNELIQVVLNILNNAIDELLQLDRDSLFIKIRLEERRDRVVIAIEDNANGIAQENLDSIFEPYYSTKGKNGTGLGLYMSQMIMQKQFNSSIEVQSSKEGSIFTMSIPKKVL